MIKKMWAVVINKVIPVCFDTEREAEEHKKKYGGEVKPVWVTDRDPFESIRKELKKKDNYMDNFDIEAIQKDLKNWDEGAG